MCAEAAPNLEFPDLQRRFRQQQMRPGERWIHLDRPPGQNIRSAVIAPGDRVLDNSHRSRDTHCSVCFEPFRLVDDDASAGAVETVEAFPANQKKEKAQTALQTLFEQIWPMKFWPYRGMPLRENPEIAALRQKLK